jgi:outer membrane protein W
MNKTLVAILIIILMSLTANAQNWSVGVSAGGGLPMGDFGDLSSFGFGGTLWGAYAVDPNFSVTARSGYMNFPGKDIGGGGITTKISYGAIPILVGGKYYFMPEGDTRVYGAGELGLYSLSVTAKTTIGSVSAEFTSSETKFAFAPTLGAQFKAGENMNVDASVNYTYVATEGKALTWLGFGVGLVWNLK